MDLLAMGVELEWKGTAVRCYLYLFFAYLFCSCDHIVLGGNITEIASSGYEDARWGEFSNVRKEELGTQVTFEATSNSSEQLSASSRGKLSIILESLPESNSQWDSTTAKAKHRYEEPWKLTITDRLGRTAIESTGITTKDNGIVASEVNDLKLSSPYFDSSSQSLLYGRVEEPSTAEDDSTISTIHDVRGMVQDVLNDHSSVRRKDPSSTSELQRLLIEFATQPGKRSPVESTTTNSWQDDRSVVNSNLEDSVETGDVLTSVVHKAKEFLANQIETSEHEKFKFDVLQITEEENRYIAEPGSTSREILFTTNALHSGSSADLEEESSSIRNESPNSGAGDENINFEAETNNNQSRSSVEEQRRRSSGSEPPWIRVERRRGGGSPDASNLWSTSTTSGDQPSVLHQTSVDWNEDEGLLLLNSTTDGISHESGLSLASLVSMVVTGIVLGLICVATVVGNLLVLLAVSLHPHLRGTTHYFVANLAGADLLLGATVLPFSASLEVVNHWSFGQLLCDAWAAMDVLCCTASILSLCVISVDRYIGVTRPLQHSTILNERRVGFIILGVWILSVTISIAPLFGWKEPPSGDPFTCDVTKQTGYVLFSVAGSFYIPLMVILVVYYRVYKEASARSRFLATGMKTSRSTDEQNCEVVLRIHTGRPLPAERSPPGPSRLKVSSLQGKKHRGHRGSTDRVGSSKGKTKRQGAAVGVVDHRSHDGRMSARHNGGGRLHPGFLDQPSSTPVGGRTRHGQPVGGAEAAGQRPVGIQSLAGKIAKFNREKKAAKTLGIVVGVFIICWFPFFFVLPLEALCSSCDVPEWLFKVMFWLGYCNSLMNPIIYSCASQEFQVAFVRLLRCRCRSRRRPVTPLVAGPRYLYHDTPAAYLRHPPQHVPPGRLRDPPAPDRLSTTTQPRGQVDFRATSITSSSSSSHSTHNLRGPDGTSSGRGRGRSSLVERNRTRCHAGPRSEQRTMNEPEEVWTSMRSRQVTML